MNESASENGHDLSANENGHVLNASENDRDYASRCLEIRHENERQRQGMNESLSEMTPGVG